MTRILFIFVLMASLVSTSNADPCRVVQGLRSQSEFLELLKLIQPTVEEFDILQKCWDNREKGIDMKMGPFSNVLRATTASRWPDSPSLSDRAQLFRPYLELELHSKNLFEQYEAIQKNPPSELPTLFSKEPNEVFESALGLLVDELKSHPYPNELSETTIDFFKEEGEPSIKELMAATYKMVLLDSVEKHILDEYVHNPEFLHPPIDLARETRYFSYRELTGAIERELPKLSKKEQSAFLLKVVRYSPDFDEFLDVRHLPELLEALNAQRNTLSPEEMNRILASIEKEFTHYERYYKHLQKYLPSLLKIAAIHQNPPAGLSLLAGPELKRVKADIAKILLTREATHPRPEVLSKEKISSFDWEALKKDPFGACKTILHGFSNN